jgi:hypothetical protein
VARKTIEEQCERRTGLKLPDLARSYAQHNIDIRKMAGELGCDAQVLQRRLKQVYGYDTETLKVLRPSRDTEAVSTQATPDCNSEANLCR